MSALGLRMLDIHVRTQGFKGLLRLGRSCLGEDVSCKEELQWAKIRRRFERGGCRAKLRAGFGSDHRSVTSSLWDTG